MSPFAFNCVQRTQDNLLTILYTITVQFANTIFVLFMLFV